MFNPLFHLIQRIRFSPPSVYLRPLDVAGLDHMVQHIARYPAYTTAYIGIAAMNIKERITIDPAICHGKPCIRGLRYPVENVLEWLAAGMTIDDIVADYSDLERDDILAVLAYAARLAHVKRLDRPAA